MTVKVRSKFDKKLHGVATHYDPDRHMFGKRSCIKVVWAVRASTAEWRRLDTIVFVVPAGRRVIE